MTDFNGPAVSEQAGVSFRKDGIYINGSPAIVLCSSVFYFRIPKGLWRDRLSKVKEAGYNAIDVYFPWNYHERKRGVWDFTGERDVEEFLKAAAEEGLWVIARPGPYICSEWDGGALPAYLFAEKQLRLRDNEPLYLEAVSRWYGQIMPLLKRFELSQGGSVIAIQLENELDFYDCREPDKYIAALRDLALEHGVQVPLFACAGQGDLYRASGYAGGVMPTCNFYPNDADPSFEEKVFAYHQELQNREYPLCVTETNRSHFLLRRLLGAGAKLLGPYLQTSGTNFGFHNAINNWGKPLAFLTSDYDFHGMITPAGEKREEYYEGKLLGGLIDGLAEKLAKAQPVPSFIQVETGLTHSDGMGYLLELSEGGYLISLPSVDQETGKAAFHDQRSGGVFPKYTEYMLSPKRCPLLIYDFPLQMWGVDGKLRYTTAELAAVHRSADQLTLVMYGDSDAELALDLPKATAAKGEGVLIRRDGEQIVICFSKENEAAAEIEAQPGFTLTVKFMSRQHAAGQEHEPEQLVSTLEQPFSIPWRMKRIASGGAALAGNRQTLGGKAKHLEEAGIYRGIAWYGAQRIREQPAQVLGLLVQDAGDVLSVYCDGDYAGTAIPGGGSAYLPLQKHMNFTELLVRAEIWGHSNFDDSALPGLRISSLKGLSGAVAVTKYENLSSNWRLGDGGTIISWGGWMTTQLPERGTYHKTIVTSASADSWVLHLPGVQCMVGVHINGQYAGEVHPMNPYVDITPFTTPGADTQISLELERYYHQSAGKVTLLEGNSLTEWWVGGSEEEELWQASEQARPQAEPCELPAALSPGEMLWLTAELPANVQADCRHVLCEGSKAKITAFFNGHLVGRVWLPGGGLRPQMTGGAQSLFYLPEPWYAEVEGGNKLSLLVEAMEEDTQLSELTFKLVAVK